MNLRKRIEAMTKMVQAVLAFALLTGLSVRVFAQTSFLDQSFGTSGKAVTFIAGGDSSDDEAHSVAVQADGRLVVAGWSSDTSAHTALAVARFNPDGTLDNTFGTGGTVRVNIAGGDSTKDMGFAAAIQPDGKIVVAGQSEDTTGGEAYVSFALARFNQNGTLDNTFGTDGTVRAFINGGGLIDEAYSIAILPDGRILAGGLSYQTFSANGLLVALGPTMGLARFNSDGSPDKSFGVNGSIEIPEIGVPLFDNAYSMAVQSDRKIVCAGGSIVDQTTDQIAFSVVRLDSNGTVDTSFGSLGVANAFIADGDSTEDMGYSVAIQPDGKIVVAGSSDGSSSPFADVAMAVARFDSNGAADNSFGTGGTVRITINGGDSVYSSGYSVALQNDGKIVISGTSGGFAVARLNANGSMDNTFGVNGTAVADSFSTDGDLTDFGWSVALQSDGKIVVAGSAQAGFGPTAFAVARFLPSNVAGITQTKSLPKSFALFQNYPNPFNPTTAISYQLSAASNVTLKVYDILGREVATLVNGRETAGNYSVTFNGSRLASGVYFYRLDAVPTDPVRRTFVSVKRFVLLK